MFPFISLHTVTNGRRVLSNGLLRLHNCNSADIVRPFVTWLLLRIIERDGVCLLPS